MYRKTGILLSAFCGDLLHRVGDCQLLVMCNLRVYRCEETDRQEGGAVFRLQHRGAGNQPGLHAAVRGEFRTALYAGENRRHADRHVLELCDETESSAGLNFCVNQLSECC